jgi:hypothetical protein
VILVDISLIHNKYTPAHSQLHCSFRWFKAIVNFTSRQRDVEDVDRLLLGLSG